MPSNFPVGAAYGPANNVDSLAEAQERERELALLRQNEVVQSFKKDVVGSYAEAQQRARGEGAVGFFDHAARRREYINRARGVAMATLEEQRKEELQTLARRYDVDRHQVKTDVLETLDIPLSVAAGIGRDVGVMAGEVQNQYATMVSGVLGVDSALGRGVDKTARVVEGVGADIQQIYADAPYLGKWVKNLREAGQDVIEMKDVNQFAANLKAIYSLWTRGFLADLAEILDEWYHDPRTLCCFIKNLAAIGKLTQAEIFAGRARADLTSFFNKIIVILKIIRTFLQKDLAFEFMLGIDLGFAIAKASSASLIAFLIALQQMIEEAVYYRMLAFVQKNVQEEWRQCFPFEKLLKILADFLVGGEGLLKYIGDYIDSFMASFSSDMNYGFNQQKKIKMIDITAIDRLIEMIEMIRDGLMSLELCIEADFRETPELTDDASRAEPAVGISHNYPPYGEGAKAGQYTTQDKNKQAKLTVVVFPTDAEVKAFIQNRLGESESFADQVIATSKIQLQGRATGAPDDQGARSDVTTDQIRKAIGDCSRIMENDKIVELARMMTSWDITL